MIDLWKITDTNLVVSVLNAGMILVISNQLLRYTESSILSFRNVLSKLLTNPVKPKSSDFLSLEEILAEGSLTNGNQESADDNRVEQLHFKAEQVLLVKLMKAILC